MSLIKCPECGKEVSSLAENCPGCGYPLAEQTTIELWNASYECNEGKIDYEHVKISLSKTRLSIFEDFEVHIEPEYFNFTMPDGYKRILFYPIFYKNQSHPFGYVKDEVINSFEINASPKVKELLNNKIKK